MVRIVKTEFYKLKRYHILWAGVALMLLSVLLTLFTSMANVNSTPFVRQYDILSSKWGVLLCQKEYQTNDIRRNSREWL